MNATVTMPNEFSLDQNFATDPTKVYRTILGASSSSDHYKQVEVLINQSAVTGAAQTVRYELVERMLDPVTGLELLSPIPVSITVIAGTAVQVAPNGGTAVTVPVGAVSQPVASATLVSATTGTIHLRTVYNPSGAVFLRVVGTVSPGTITGRARFITGNLGVN